MEALDLHDDDEIGILDNLPQAGRLRLDDLLREGK